MIQLGILAVSAAKWAAASIDKDDVLRAVHHVAKSVADKSKHGKVVGAAQMIATATAPTRSHARPRHGDAGATGEPS